MVGGTVSVGTVDLAGSVVSMGVVSAGEGTVASTGMEVSADAVVSAGIVVSTGGIVSVGGVVSEDGRVCTGMLPAGFVSFGRWLDSFAVVSCGVLEGKTVDVSGEEAVVISGTVEETVSEVASSEDGSVWPWGRMMVVCR